MAALIHQFDYRLGGRFNLAQASRLVVPEAGSGAGSQAAQHQARHDAYAQVYAELEALDIPTDGLGDRSCEGPIVWSLDGLTCTTCGTGLETLYYQIQSAPEEKARLIAQHAPPDEEGSGAPEFELLRLHDVIKTRDISTAEELEAALSELRQAVEAAIEAGKRVILG